MAKKSFAKPKPKVESVICIDDAPGEVVIRNFSGYFLLVCIVVAAIFLLIILEPFITVLILAAILATAFSPLYLKILEKLSGRARLASFLTVLIIFFLLLIPLCIFILLLGKQALDTYVYIQESIRNGFLDPYIKWENGGVIYDMLGALKYHLNGFIDFESINLKESITDVAKIVTTYLAEQSANLIKGFGWFLLRFFILLFALYYMFKDAYSIVDKIMTLSPLPDKHEKELFRKFKEISHATLYGIFLTSIVQGIIGGVGFAIAGIPNALFWGTAIAVFSLVPIVGTAAIWFPAAVFLLISGNLLSGGFLFLWGMLIVSTSDNVLRSVLIGGKANMNQLLTFLAVFGGVLAFNLIGVIFGPLILMLFFAFLHIYETEYDKVLHK